MNKHTLGFIAVVLGNAIFGFSFLFSKLALDLTVPAVLIAVRFTVAFLVLNLIVLVSKPWISFSLKGKPKKDILLLALFQPILYFIAENYGIVYTSSSYAGIIIALIPIVGIVLDYLFFHEKIRLRQSLCAIASVAGVFLTTVGATNMRSSLKGTLFLFVAVLGGSFFYVFSKQSSEHYNPLERTYVMFGLGSAFYVIFALITCYGQFQNLIVIPLQQPVFWMSIAYLAVVSSVMAFLLLNFGSNYVSVSQSTLLANLTTIISIFAGVFILKESFTIMQVAGSVIIFFSVYIATAKK